MHGTGRSGTTRSDDLFGTLVSGLDHEERIRTLELINRRIAEDRLAALEGRPERRAGGGGRHTGRHRHR